MNTAAEAPSRSPRAPGAAPGRLLALLGAGWVATVGPWSPAALSAPTPSVGGVPAAAVAGRSLSIDSFHTDLSVYRSGSLDVTETIQFRFQGSWNGVYRTIPIDYRGASGFNYRLYVAVKSVQDGDGRPLRHETSRSGGNLRLKIYVPGARDTEKTVQIRYRVENGLRFFNDYDELYWNVTGTAWPLTIESASATVHLPTQVQGVRAQAFTGTYGSRAHNASIDVQGPLIQVRTTQSLNLHEGLSVDVAWNAGVIARPSFLRKVGWFLRGNWPVGLPLLVFPAMFGLWWRRGRDPRLRPIAARYEPPEGLTPGEEGVLVDDSPDMRDITATLVDLAVRGFITIEEHDKKKLLGLGTDRDYAFDLERPIDQWKDLAPHEEALLNGIFDNGVSQHVELDVLENSFYKSLPGIKDRLFEGLMRRGYYGRRPDRVRGTWLGVAFVGAVLGLMGGLNLAGHFALSGVAVGVGVVLSALIVAGFGWFMPAKTEAGTRALEAVLGFEEFLKRVEEDRFKRMIKGPKDFERFLPHAMALGVEKTWAKAFDGIYTEPPSWYRGASPMGFQPTLFVASLGNMSARTGSVMASQPRSSAGSSGFGGGGGFSGGGFGGGGGGGF